MREYRLMPWHTELLTTAEVNEIIRDQDARHKAAKAEARRQRGR